MLIGVAFRDVQSMSDIRAILGPHLGKNSYIWSFA